ncbi:MAG: FAD-binding protein [Gammaproteobacteria bacterium]|nr:MAG: FAD-binding protein [Gammaproteobacteria bacterium]
MSLFVDKLKRLLPKELIIADEELLRAYECDALSAYRQLPSYVVMPESVDQVQAIMRLCHQENVPVVARGAGTGLSGGAMPVEDGLLLSLAKFNQIVHLDPDQRIATVQPGVRNISVSEAVEKYGLFYAPDPSSQIACTIGGNVAENSGGVHCLKYGLTVHNILAVKLITVTGELLEIGADSLDSAGYDLLALMTGSEGMLGVIVEVTLKLISKPLNNRVLLAAFDEIEEAGKGVADIIASGIIPAGLEMMDNGVIKAVEDYLHAGYPVNAAAILICEVDGAEEEVDEECRKVKAILEVAGASDVRVARNKEEGDKFWEGRKSAFPAVGRIAADYYCMDGTIPRKHIGSVLNRIDELAKQYKLGVVNVFHAGDGNLHPLILYDVSIEGELERAEELGGKILEVCVEVGGTITGEHGVGIEKINQMCVQFNAEELVQFHAIKNAFDPKGLLNPGKAIPTLNRCAEFGAMHIHRGELPHPDLERF